MDAHIKKLLEKYGKNDQRTDEWHTKRGEMLTASEIYKALATASTALKREIVVSKLTPRVQSTGNGPRALLWGTRFEPIAKEIYMMENIGVQIADTTCIPHPEYSFLGASPDGIILSEDERHGTLVEFKCPISRVFDNTTPIPNEYYHQMQLQMECTELKECDYVENKFVAGNYTAWMDSNAKYKSCFAVNESTNEVLYREIEDETPVKIWKQRLGGDLDDWEIQYWTMEHNRSEIVPLQTDWLSSNIGSFTQIWEEICTHRKNGTMPEKPQDKNVLTL